MEETIGQVILRYMLVCRLFMQHAGEVVPGRLFKGSCTALSVKTSSKTSWTLRQIEQRDEFMLEHAPSIKWLLRPFQMALV